MKPLVSFDWPEGKAKQLAYISQDHHIHEFHVGIGGTWQHTDLSLLASAPLATSRFLVGYAWPQEGTKQIAYLGPDGHIHELWVSAGGSWQHADLSAITGAPPAIQITAGYSWTAGNTKQITFVGDDAHLHELYMPAGQSWQHIDLTALTNAPLPGSYCMVGYEWIERCSKQLVYVGRDGHLHELFLKVGGNWEHSDLTMLTNAPRTTDVMVGYEWRDGRCQQIALVSEDGHIHELYMAAGGSWQHADLSALTAAPSATNILSGYAWDGGHSKQIAYVGRDGHIHEIYVEAGKTWRHVDLTELSQAPVSQITSIAGSAWAAGDSKQVAYVGNDGNVRELWMPRHDGWKAANLSNIVTAVPARF
jgi:hypothetical protein